MSKYVLKRIDGKGGFVADQRKRAGGSYTNNILNAKIYSSREAAYRDSCVENERVVNLDELLGGR